MSKSVTGASAALALAVFSTLITSVTDVASGEENNKLTSGSGVNYLSKRSISMKPNILIYIFILFITDATLVAQVTPLPGEEGTKPAIIYDYFPSRMHAFIWRNWTVVSKDKLAEVLGTNTKNVDQVARSMGLPKQGKILQEWASSRGYITVLRRNWHLLPYEQILHLLSLSREELAFKLIEDDFLFTKLGSIKPHCEPLRYTKPTKEMEVKAAKIALYTKGMDAFNKEIPRFAFINDFQEPESTIVPSQDESNFDLRLIYSYFADFGDPLLDPDLKSYPEGMLQKLSQEGVNGIWLHSVLRMLVLESDGFPGDEKALQRIEGLNRLVKRAAKYGIKIYLYVNEPRSMHHDFFSSNPDRNEWGGVREGDLQAFCTSNPEVLKWLSSSLEQVFKQVVGLGGVFTITASENLTSCASHGNHSQCSRCAKRSFGDIIAEINTAIYEGVTSGNPDAKVLVWDWGWIDAEAEHIINNLPKNCWLMSVSEWSMPIERGGIESHVGEYSISSVGPGPRAIRHWRMAKNAGLKTVAKVQVNSTWEIAAVPAIPALDLIASHAENLSNQDINGVMLSWSLGGYPSENLKLFQSLKQGEKEEALKKLAEETYGKEIAGDVRKSWQLCSESFKEYPYHIGTLYKGPQQTGPANPFFIKPSGYSATMVGIPYDDVNAWRSIYPVQVWVSQLDKCSRGFFDGVAVLKNIEKKPKGAFLENLESLQTRMEVVEIHLRSAAEQARFTDARNRFLASNTMDEEKKLCIAEMRKAAYQELELIQSLLPLVKKDPTIGFESSNHYFYLPIDLLEAHISVQYTVEWLNTL